MLAAHGVAGLTGILFIGFFAQKSWNGVSDGLLFGNAAQLGHQALAVLVTPAYAFAMTFLILRAIALVMPLRATEHEEARGDGRRPARRGGLRDRARARSWSRRSQSRRQTAIASSVHGKRRSSSGSVSWPWTSQPPPTGKPW